MALDESALSELLDALRDPESWSSQTKEGHDDNASHRTDRDHDRRAGWSPEERPRQIERLEIPMISSRGAPRTGGPRRERTSTRAEPFGPLVRSVGRKRAAT